MTKVSIFGTHFSGKTTLAQTLAKETHMFYHQSDKSLEISKEMHIKSLDELEQMDINSKFKFQLKMLDSLKESIDNSITDGNPISCIPYGKKLLNENLYNTELGKMVIKNAVKYSNNYDYLFYLPPEIDFEKDDFRHSGKEFRMTVAKELIENMSLNYKVLTGSVDERVKTAKYMMKLENKPARHNHIVFEGICNSGKSTILKMVMEELKKEKINYYYADRQYSPNSNISEDKLELMYSDLNKYKNDLIDSYMNLFSYTSEYHNIEDKIKSGEIVFSDRHKFSVIALGLAVGYDINYMYRITSHLKTAGTIIFFDLPYEEGVRRAGLNEKSMKSIRQNMELQKMMSEGFKKLAQIHCEVKIVDSMQTKQDLFNNVYEIIKKTIE
jgi:thymidylate kinase